MPDAEGVVFALVARRERRQTVLQLDPAQARAPTRQYFVRVRLVPNVPEQSVARRLIDIVQGDREIHRTQSGGKVPALLAYRVDEVGSNFRRDAAKRTQRQSTQVVRGIDFAQQRVAHYIHSSRGNARAGTSRPLQKWNSSFRPPAPLLVPRSDILKPHSHPVDRSVSGRCSIHRNQFNHHPAFVLEMGGQTAPRHRRSRA